MRTDKIIWFLDMAERCARQGTCNRRVFGSVIVDHENHIISTGYNGAPHDVVDCLQLGTCWRKDHNIPSGSNYEKCRAVHAESNAINQAGKNARGATIYIAGISKDTGKLVDARPCAMCARLILNARMSKIVIRRENGEVFIRTPQELNELWDAEIFRGESVDWAALKQI